MGIYSQIKEQVSSRDVAVHYGYKVSRNGMMRCPFHNDRNPSMKVDKRFHCFGCGADGDVIRFTAKLFDLSIEKAAEKIVTDFGIDVRKQKPVSAGSERRKRQQRYFARRYEAFENKFYRILTDYIHLLRRWKEEHAPESADEEWDEWFCEALQNLAEPEYIADRILESDLEEKIDIMNEYGEKVKQFEERINEYRTGETGKTEEDDESVFRYAG